MEATWRRGNGHHQKLYNDKCQVANAQLVKNLKKVFLSESLKQHLELTLFHHDTDWCVYVSWAGRLGASVVLVYFRIVNVLNNCKVL